MTSPWSSTSRAPTTRSSPRSSRAPRGPIVDEEVFSADSITPDEDIVAAEAFAGQYKITSYDFNNLISYEPFADYKGVLPPAESPINAKYYADSSNLKLDVQEGNIDVAFRSLSATDVDDPVDETTP